MAAYISDFVTRAEWGADESLMTWNPEFYALQKLTVHHTVTQNGDPDPAATVNTIYEYHAVDRGYGDIGYQALVDEQGQVYEGRYTGDSTDVGHGGTGDQQVTAAHTSGSNSGNYGIALLGTFDTVNPTAAARDSLEKYLADLCDRHGLDPQSSSDYTNPVNGNVVPNQPNISGHRDWTDTACPGDELYNDLPGIRTNTASLLPPPEDDGGSTTGVPIALPSGKFPIDPSFVGPFTVGSNLYVFAVSTTTDFGDLRCFKSTDGGDTWTDQGAWNKGADEIRSVWAAHDANGGYLRVLIQDVGGFVAYKAFDLSTDSWSSFAGQGLGTFSTSVYGVALTCRSDSTLVAMFQGDTEAFGKGKNATNRNRIQWATRNSSGTWTLQGDLDGAGVDADYFVGAAALGGSNRSHLFYTGGDTVKHRAVSALNTLGSAQDLDTGTGTATRPISAGIYDEDNTQVVVPYQDGDDTLAVIRADSGTLDLGSVTVDLAVSDQTVAVADGAPPAGATAFLGDVHLLYSSADASDLWRDTRTNGAWGTDLEALNNVTVERVSATNDGQDLLVLYSDAGAPTFVRITVVGPQTVDASPASVRANGYDAVADAVAGSDATAATASTASHDATVESATPNVTVDATAATTSAAANDATVDPAATVDAATADSLANSADATVDSTATGDASVAPIGTAAGDATPDATATVDATVVPATTSSFDATSETGTATADADPAIATTNASDASVEAGAAPATVDAAVATASVTATDANVDSLTATDANTATVAATSTDATGAPGPIGTDATAGAATTAANDATVATAAEPQTVDAAAATLTTASFDATTATGGEVSTDPATATASAHDATGDPGPSTADADPAATTAASPDATVDPTTGVDAPTLSIDLSANDAANTPGPATADGTAATASVGAHDATVAGGGQVSTDPATLTVAALDATADPGPTGVDAAANTLTVSAQSADTAVNGLADSANTTVQAHDATVDQQVDADTAPIGTNSADAAAESTSRADATQAPVSAAASDAGVDAGDPAPTALSGAVSTASSDATALAGPTHADGASTGATVAAHDATADTEGQAGGQPATVTTAAHDADTEQVTPADTAETLFTAGQGIASYTVGSDGAALGTSAHDADTDSTRQVTGTTADATVTAHDADPAPGPIGTDAEQAGLVTAAGGRAEQAQHADQAQLVLAVQQAAIDQATARLHVVLGITANDAEAGPGPTYGDPNPAPIGTTAHDGDPASTFGVKPERTTVTTSRQTAGVTTTGQSTDVDTVSQAAVVSTDGTPRKTVSTSRSPLTIST